MLSHNFQQNVWLNGLMQKIHCFSYTQAVAQESQRWPERTYLIVTVSCCVFIFYLQGVLHTNGGYMVYTATTFKYAFDYKPSDVYWYSSMYFCGYAYCKDLLYVTIST